MKLRQDSRGHFPSVECDDDDLAELGKLTSSNHVTLVFFSYGNPSTTKQTTCSSFKLVSGLLILLRILFASQRVI
jgi:hypothetical protein